MIVLLGIDWLGLQERELEWHQMLVRGLIVFIVAIVFIRLAGMRTFGTQSAFDVVLSITLGALLSRCITGHYPFFPTLAAALFLAFLHRLFAWMSFHNSMIRHLIEGDAVPLFRDGKKIQKNLAKHSISEIDIVQSMREENIDDFDKVKSIWLEADGKISIVKKG